MGHHGRYPNNKASFDCLWKNLCEVAASTQKPRMRFRDLRFEEAKILLLGFQGEVYKGLVLPFDNTATGDPTKLYSRKIEKRQ